MLHSSLHLLHAPPTPQQPQNAKGHSWAMPKSAPTACQPCLNTSTLHTKGRRALIHEAQLGEVNIQPLAAIRRPGAGAGGAAPSGAEGDPVAGVVGLGTPTGAAGGLGSGAGAGGMDLEDFETVCVPSAHCAFALARQLLLKYGDVDEMIRSTAVGAGGFMGGEAGTTRGGMSSAGGGFGAPSVPGGGYSPPDGGMGATTGGGMPTVPAFSALVRMGITCLYDFIRDLGNKDESLGLRALTPLFTILEGLAPAELSGEAPGLIEDLFGLLNELASSSCEDLSALATSSLLALTVATGNPNYFIEAAGLLISRPLADSLSDSIQIPENFRLLYRTVTQAASTGLTLGRSHHSVQTPAGGGGNQSSGSSARSMIPNCANWLSTSIKANRAFCIKVPNPPAVSGSPDSESSPTLPSRLIPYGMACDGRFLYVMSNTGLTKIGTGCGDTVSGTVYEHNSKIFCDDLAVFRENMWITVFGANILIRRRISGKLMVVNCESLEVTGEILLQTPVADGILCALPSTLNLVRIDAENNLVMHRLDSNFILSGHPEFRIRLTQTKYHVSGEHANLDLPSLVATLKHKMEEKVKDIRIGKDIALFLTESGKVFYSGKGSIIGMADNANQWSELLLPDPVDKISLGHSGSHILLCTTNGHVYFAGLATRGEDGGKVGIRRHASSSKAKKLSLPDGKRVTSIASNSGSSALVSEDGNLFIFGKDTQCCDHTGHVSRLDSPVVQVALGRAHVIVLTRHGHVYSFGMNTFGQCGRTDGNFGSYPRGSPMSGGGGGGDTSDSDRSSRTDDDMPSEKSHPSTPASWCPPGTHVWMSSSPGGGWCARCGRCAVHGTTCPRASPRRIIRALQSAAAEKLMAVCVAPEGEGPVEGPCLRCGLCRVCGTTASPRHASDIKSSTTTGRDSDSDSRVSDLTVNPGRVTFKGQLNLKVTQVACGNYHTLLLTSEGTVITFGSNRYGQLGVGDYRSHVGPQIVQQPANVVQVAAGAYHSLLRTRDGGVYSFGRNHVGQLCRDPQDEVSLTIPAAVEGFGSPASERRAVWVGASADASFIKYELSVLSTDAIREAVAVGNSRYLLIFPRHHSPRTSQNRSHGDFTYLVVDRLTGSSRHFKCDLFHGPEIALCMDHRYDVLWYFCQESASLRCFSPDLDIANQSMALARVDLFHPEFWLPAEPRQSASTQHLGRAVLVLYKLLVACRHLAAADTDYASCAASIASFTDEYATVDRFQSYGGGWGYSAQSVEAIQFMCEQTVTIAGFGLLGGRGEYTARMRLMRITGQDLDAASEEQNAEVIAETEEILYQCPSREKYHAFLRKPVLCHADEWYVITACINGPSSDCGSGGLPVVVAEDGAVFHFRNSRLSNNGTDIHAGQIAQILFRPVANVGLQGAMSPLTTYHSVFRASRHQLSPPSGGGTTSISAVAFPLDQLRNRLAQTSSRFSTFVSDRALKGLLRIMSHCVEHTMHYSVHPDLFSVSERLVTVNTVCVDILRHFLLNIYPEPSSASSTTRVSESKLTVELIEGTFQTLANIFSCASNVEMSARLEQLVNASMQLVTSAFHVFFPSADIVRWQLTSLLQPGQQTKNDWLLCAILKGLSKQSHPVAHMIASPRTSSGAAKSTQSAGGAGAATEYPLLKAHILSERRSATPAASSNGKELSFDFQNVLTTVLRFIFDVSPSGSSSSKDKSMSSQQLRDKMQRNAANFVLKTTSDLVSYSVPVSSASTAVIMQTPSRFGRTSSTMSWDTSNGTPDAIAFQVDAKAISMHGVGVFVGVGAAYAYTLELLVNCGDATSEHWQLLEKVAGNLCAGPDGEIAFIKLNKPVKLVPFIQYAFRVQLTGNRTWSGENGVASVTGYKGVSFAFSSCSLSVNGTNVARGQIPIFLYSIENDANVRLISPDKAINWVMATMKQVAQQIQRLCSASLVKELVKSGPRVQNIMNFLCYFCGLIGLFLTRCPSHALDCLRVLDELLPIVCSIQQQGQRKKGEPTIVSGLRRKASGPNFNVLNTQNFVQTVVESSHPYTPSSVTSTFANFDDSVKYMVLEFDSQCATAQPEDCLTIYVITPEESMLTVAKFSGTNWNQRPLILPGNAIWFVMETASLASKEISSDLCYGFKCTITGIGETKDSLSEVLECELSYLCAMCCSILLTESAVSSILGMEASCKTLNQHEADDLLADHGVLLRKGLRLSHQPYIYELKKLGKLPPAPVCQIAKFLNEFAAASSDTSAGRLAQWLMPVPYLDLSQCDLVIDCGGTHVQSGRPLVITVVTKDQYGRVTLVPDLVIEITLSAASDNTRAGGNAVAPGGAAVNNAAAAPSTPERITQTSSFQPTYLNRARYCSITMMQAYQNHSFEELRLAHCYEAALRTSLVVSSNNDGYHTATWIPKKSGLYEIDCLIDGFSLDRHQTIEVQNGRVVTKSSNLRLVKAASRLLMASVQADFTQGVRIRSSPSLFAEQLGVIPPGTVIFYVEEMENAEGNWLRLSDDTALGCCPGVANPTHTWCLQYHAALGRTLVYATEDGVKVDQGASSVVSEPFPNMTNHSVIVACEERYFVIKCPPSEEPSGSTGPRLLLKDSPKISGKVVGSLSLDDEISTIGWLQNNEGVWVQLSRACFDLHCYAATKPSTSTAGAANSNAAPFSGSTSTSGIPTNAFALVQPGSEQVVYLERIITPDGILASASSWAGSNPESAAAAVAGTSRGGTVGDGQHKSGGSPFVFGLSSSRHRPASSSFTSRQQQLSQATNAATRAQPKPMAKVTPTPHIQQNSQAAIRVAQQQPGNSQSSSTIHAGTSMVADPAGSVAAQSTNGHHPQPEQQQLSVALSPSVANAARYAFAAVLWHSGAVHDAIACATYLKFHNELHSLRYRRHMQTSGMNNDDGSLDDMQELVEFNIPYALRLLLCLWREIYDAVMAIVSQHLILPSPPMAIRAGGVPAGGDAGLHGNPAAPVDMPAAGGAAGPASGNDLYCELCECWYPAPVTSHMKNAHPGCGVHAGGQGYNSLGRYSSGWSGNCGEGGHGTAVWYLLCGRCRQKYMKTTGAYRERQRRHRGRYFRSNGTLESPQNIIRNNAAFLLELNSACLAVGHDAHGPGSVSRNDWSITMFPQVLTSPPRLSSRSSSISGYQSNESILGGPPYGHYGIAHADAMDAQCSSDPGPKIKAHPGEVPAPIGPFGGTKCSWPSCYPSNDHNADAEQGETSTNLISSPSPALQTAVNRHTDSRGGSSVTLNSTLRRPVMSFIIKHHDLPWIRTAMEISVARSASLSHAFQVLSWILRLLNSNQAVHGVIYHLIRALCKRPYDTGGGAACDDVICHPLSLIPFSGPWGYPVLFHFHNFLVTVANLLSGHRGMNIEEQRLCLQTWAVKFSVLDHGLILKCRILNIVNRILSAGGLHAAGAGPLGSNSRALDASDRVVIEATDDATGQMKVDASSRKAMLPCLLDGTTETFWESGEEDRNRSKWLYATLTNESVQAVLLSLYIDNVKDSSNRVYQVVFHSVDASSKNRRRIKSQSLTARFTGWVKCVVGTAQNIIHIELKSQDAFVRVRQIYLSGHVQKPSTSAAPMRKSSSYLHHFSSIQADAFRVFKLITMQAFGETAEPTVADVTLRNMVFDMAFNGGRERGSTAGLQGYVIRQIASAMEKEIALLKEGVKSSYSYCTGLMTMLEKICMYPLGCECLKGKQNLLFALASLLIFAPQGMQASVIQLLRRLLPIFEPYTLDHQRLLNIFLVPVAKILTVQVKEVSKRQSVTTVTAATSLTGSWHLDRQPSMATATLVIQLCRDIANGTHGNLWGENMCAICGTHILGLAILSPEARNPAVLLCRKPFWYAMAALLVLENESWLQNSPLWASIFGSPDSPGGSADEDDDRAGGSSAAPLCDNHDDGQTAAAAWCAECRMHLCRECTPYFHLNRRTREHRITTILSAAEDAVTVNVRESCGRLKLSWLMAVADSVTMNGIVEFRDDSAGGVAGVMGGQPWAMMGMGVGGVGGTKRSSCRFCPRPSDPGGLLNTCDAPECVALNASACVRLLPCGHMCPGIAGEADCPPCLRCGGVALRQDAEDMCMICFTDVLSAAPVIRIACGHVFHHHCVRTALDRRWPGPRISFTFMHCPICKAQIDHPSVLDLLRQLQVLVDDVSRKALMRLEFDGLRHAPALSDPSSPFYQDPEAYACDRYAYYVCYECGKAYYGGEAHCAAAAANLDFDPKELVCGACSDVSQAQICPKHGTDFLEYKCRYCCGIAVFFCFGTTHFCGACHDDFQRLVAVPSHALPECPVGPRGRALDRGQPCPLQVDHPRTGEEFALGCGICRNIETF